jgi:hypothetical protein
MNDFYFSQKPVSRRLEYTLQRPAGDAEEPSTRCSFTDRLVSDLDPRSPISISIISNDITLP